MEPTPRQGSRASNSAVEQELPKAPSVQTTPSKLDQLGIRNASLLMKLSSGVSPVFMSRGFCSALQVGKITNGCALHSTVGVRAILALVVAGVAGTEYSAATIARNALLGSPPQEKDIAPSEQAQSRHQQQQGIPGLDLRGSPDSSTASAAATTAIRAGVASVLTFHFYANRCSRTVNLKYCLLGHGSRTGCESL
jgi:hypothetical protein